MKFNIANNYKGKCFFLQSCQNIVTKDDTLMSFCNYSKYFTICIMAPNNWTVTLETD